MSQTACLCAPPDARAPGRVRPATRTAGLPDLGYLTRLAAAVGRLALHWRRRASIRDLHRLGDCELRDIGIDRGGIDAIIDELGDTAEVMLAVDQSYHIAFPLVAAVHAANASGSSDSTFTDAAAFTDCGRPEGFVLFGQPGEDDAFPDEFSFF
jgi:uncharacterized protein YjiS (DUF1127 family)